MSGMTRVSRVLAVFVALGALLSVGAGWMVAQQKSPQGTAVSASASGEALVVLGTDPFALDRAAATSGRLEARGTDAGGRWSALQSKDTVDVTAEFSHPRDGVTYRVVVNTPMRQEPQGRYTTWFGISQGHAHHGDTGIDTPRLPRVASELAFWGYAEVFRDGQKVATNAPAHMMVVKRDQGSLPGQVFLSVATDEKNLTGVPDGYLNVVWKTAGEVVTAATHGSDLHTLRETAGNRAPADFAHLLNVGWREAFGWGGLIVIVAGSLLLALRPGERLTALPRSGGRA